MMDLYLKIGLFFLNWFIQKNQNNKEMVALFNGFIKQLSVHSEVANKQALKIEELLEKKQKEIKERIKNEAKP